MPAVSSSLIMEDQHAHQLAVVMLTESTSLLCIEALMQKWRGLSHISSVITKAYQAPFENHMRFWYELHLVHEGRFEHNFRQTILKQ